MHNLKQKQLKSLRINRSWTYKQITHHEELMKSKANLRLPLPIEC